MGRERMCRAPYVHGYVGLWPRRLMSLASRTHILCAAHMEGVSQEFLGSVDSRQHLPPLGSQGQKAWTITAARAEGAKTQKLHYTSSISVAVVGGHRHADRARRLACGSHNTVVQEAATDGLPTCREYLWNLGHMHVRRRIARTRAHTFGRGGLYISDQSESKR